MVDGRRERVREVVGRVDGQAAQAAVPPVLLCQFEGDGAAGVRGLSLAARSASAAAVLPQMRRAWVEFSPAGGALDGWAVGVGLLATARNRQRVPVLACDPVVRPAQVHRVGLVGAPIDLAGVGDVSRRLS